jgi:hypothetical protein
VIDRMPVPREDYWSIRFAEFLNVLVQHRDDLIAISYGKRSARAKVVLNVHDNQSRMLIDLKRQP